MKATTKPQDAKAEAFTFGVEIETAIPATSGITVGCYHRGLPVTTGRRTCDWNLIPAPSFNGAQWKAERVGSIRYGTNEMACEFVSPIFQGSNALDALAEFTQFLDQIGARVNDSCGVHITVGVNSIIGSTSTEARAEFVRKLAHLARWHAKAVYGQTGTDRHLNTSYAAPLQDDVELHVRQMVAAPDFLKSEAANRCGRGMVNFKKLFSHGLIEFRAFAGTTNFLKLEHHIATVLGLCRRAAEVQCLGGFKKNKLQQASTLTAVDSTPVCAGSQRRYDDTPDASTCD